MWLRRSTRDLVETLAAAAPEGGAALPRLRAQMLDLLMALHRPACAAPESSLRADVARALDEAIARALPVPRIAA